MKFLVIEIQEDESGNVGTLINDYTTMPEAESKYHTVLAAAAISSVANHSAVLMLSNGDILENKSYKHNN